jgi:hypothetical protein
MYGATALVASLFGPTYGSHLIALKKARTIRLAIAQPG